MKAHFIMSVLRHQRNKTYTKPRTPTVKVWDEKEEALNRQVLAQNHDRLYERWMSNYFHSQKGF